MLVFLSPTRSRSPISYNSKPCARLQVKNTCNGGKLRNNPNSQSQIPNSIFPPLTFYITCYSKENYHRQITAVSRRPLIEFPHNHSVELTLCSAELIEQRAALSFGTFLFAVEKKSTLAPDR